MTAHCVRCVPVDPSLSPHYFVCLMDYRSAGQEAVVDPSIDRAEVIARLKTREYKNVVWIHHIHDGVVEDVTLAMIGEARGLVFA